MIFISRLTSSLIVNVGTCSEFQIQYCRPLDIQMTANMFGSRYTGPLGLVLVSGACVTKVHGIKILNPFLYKFT